MAAQNDERTAQMLSGRQTMLFTVFSTLSSSKNADLAFRRGERSGQIIRQNQVNFRARSRGQFQLQVNRDLDCGLDQIQVKTELTSSQAPHIDFYRVSYTSLRPF